MAYRPAQLKPVFQPSMRVVTNITNAAIAMVTTNIPHQYIVGLVVRIDMPIGTGMPQINQQFGTILTIPSPTTFTISIDTTLYDPFIGSPGYPPAYSGDPQCVPFAEDNSILTGAVRNVLPYSAS